MPCEWLEGPGGTVMHINRRGGSPGRLMKCKFCNRNYREAHGKLCDFPVGNGKTCDAAMCPDCATTLGAQKTDIGGGFKRLNDTRDVCPIHKGQPWPEGK